MYLDFQVPYDVAFCPYEGSLPNALAGSHFLILQMADMVVISYVSLFSRASDIDVWLFIDYSKTLYESAPTTILHRNHDDILDYFESHLVLEEYHKVLAHVY